MKEEPLRIHIHDLAIADFQRLRANSPDVYRELIAGLKALAHENDPRRPLHNGLNAVNMFPTGRGSYRLKCKGQQWRAVFRVFERGGGVIVQIMPHDMLDDDAERWIEVVYADVRDDTTYGSKFTARYERVQEAGS